MMPTDDANRLEHDPMFTIRLTDCTDTRRPQFDVICERLTATPTTIALHGVAAVTSVTTAAPGPERAEEFKTIADVEGGRLLFTPEDWSIRVVPAAPLRETPEEQSQREAAEIICASYRRILPDAT